MKATMTERRQLDRAAVAALLGVEPGTITRYRDPNRGENFPEPDGFVGRSPWWWSDRIEAWRDARPGRGAGGGRPWHRERKTPA